MTNPNDKSWPVPELDPVSAEIAAAEDRPDVSAIPLSIRRSTFLIVLACAAISVLVAIFVGYRSGSTLLALTMAGAGVARLVVHPRYSLGLMVRTRRIDAITYFCFAFAVFFSAWMVPD